MAIFVLKVVSASLVISFCSWLSNKEPELAGFIVALPITTLLVLLFSYAEFKDSSNSVTFAKSIFVGIPVSLLFFVPFLLAQKLDLGFGVCYALGLTLLVVGFYIHRWVLTLI